jgi:hypothetical protein
VTIGAIYSSTKKNKFRRPLEIDSTCSICGTAEEDSFHAIVECTKAHALRAEMRKHWDLPMEKAFHFTGPDWLHVLLADCSHTQRGNILLLLWRSWHLRCDIIHKKGEETIMNSVSFLLSYIRYLHT